MYRADPTRIISKRFTANGSITQKDLAHFNRAIIGSAGIRLKIVQSDDGNHMAGKNLFVRNESDGPASIWRDDAFGTADDTMIILPGEEFELECVDLQSAGTYKWVKKGLSRPSPVTSATPTPTWTTFDPTVTSNTMWYSIVTNGQAQGFFFHGKIVISDGKDSAGLTLALPAGIVPNKLALKVPIDMRVTVDGTPTDAIAYVDLNSDTAATRALIVCAAFPTLTDTKVCEVSYSGFLPLANWFAFTPEFAYTVGTATFAEVGYMMLLGENTYAMVAQSSTADSDAESSITLVPPIIPQDLDVLGSCKAMEIAGAGGVTYSNPIPTIELASATGESRLISNLALTTATDAQIFAWSCAAILPIRNWQAWTPDPTYTTADPTGTLVQTGYFDAYDSLTFLTGYISFTDGNGATAVVTTGLPIPPRSICTKIPIPSTQVQHTDVFVNPMCFLDSDDGDPDDRAVEQDNLTTWDDTEVGKLQYTGFYLV